MPVLLPRLFESYKPMPARRRMAFAVLAASVISDWNKGRARPTALFHLVSVPCVSSLNQKQVDSGKGREAVFSVTLTSAESIICLKCQKAERELKVEKKVLLTMWVLLKLSQSNLITSVWMFPRVNELLVGMFLDLKRLFNGLLATIFTFEKKTVFI